MIMDNDDIQKILKKWQLSNVRPFKHIEVINNYIFIVYSCQYKKDVVLKFGLKKIIDQEIQALQYFQGNACVKLLQFDQEFSDTNSALLLEYLQPGHSLKDLFLQGKEKESIEIFVDVVKKIHLNLNKNLDFKIKSNFQTVEQKLSLLHTFQSKNDQLVQLLPHAIKLADKLIATQGNQCLLHGDLHHENILQQNDAWVMIDPQGVIGELAYEVGAFIRNPLFELLDQNNLESLMLYRFERLNELLHLDKQRIIDWSFVQAVLAACYSEQDGQQAAQQYFITVAKLIVNITRPDYKLDISVTIVQQLVFQQFSQWADLTIRSVNVSGWDNRTFHLGDTMSVRLPSGQEYAAQVVKEQKWLPFLASHLSIQISQPIAMGRPSKHYPFHWSVYKWIDGQSANMFHSDDLDLNIIAVQLAQFLYELHQIDSVGGPVTDRGGSPIFYDDEARSMMMQLQNVIDVNKAKVVWDKAIKSRWNKHVVWAHGDLSSGNILIKDKQLCAVIDFGSITIGDPACDLVIAWTFLQGESRQIFKNHMNLDVDTWARARGWALWKAMITLAPMSNKTSLQAIEQLRIIHDILDEHGTI